MTGRISNLRITEKHGLCLKVLSLLLTALLIISLNGIQVSAVAESTMAADGVYSTSLTAYKYKYGKLDKTYTGILNVAVSDGEIAGLWVSNASSDKMSKLITNEIYYTYVGKTASVSAVQGVNGVDAVSSASVTGTTSSVNSSVKKQYVADIQGAIVTALGKASARSGSSSGSTSTAVKTVQGTASVSDAEGSKIVLDVGLDSDGKIVSLTANDASVSDWSSILSKVSSDYVGKTASQIDAISGATQYTTAVNTAVIAAMAKVSASESGNSGSNGSTGGNSSSDNTSNVNSGTASDSGKTIKPGESATIAVGETVTLDGTHYSMANSESWSSSNTAVATVAASGGSYDYDSDATVTGVSAGTATITHTMNSLLGSPSTETFMITVTASGSGSESGSGSNSDVSDSVSGVTSIKVTKEWKNDVDTDRPSSVTVGIYNGSTKVQTLTLNKSNSWTATATGLTASNTYTIKEDAVDGYTTTITKGEATGGNGAGGWTAQSYGNVEAGKTYAFTYTSNGTTYLLGRSGTSVIGTTSGLSGGVPSNSIGNDYKWEISKATSGTSYGAWLAKNLGNNYYLAPYNGYSTSYSNAAILQSSTSIYSNVNLNFDNDGSIWNGYGSLNIYATGTTVKSDTSSFTKFTPYLYTEGGSSAQTANYTITNTKTNSGSGSGSDSGNEGGDEETADPAHVKAISPKEKVADSYNITLNVTGQSKTTTSTTQTGESTTSPYDILLVLDNTLSMTTSYGNTTRLAAMKSAAQSFVNGLPAADGSKIAMVSFVIGDRQSPTTTNVNWTAFSEGKDTVKTQIGQLTAPDSQYGYDTYFTQPLERASSLLDSVSGDGNKKYVVFFTDGASAESVGTIQSLASSVKGKADATFSIGIVSGSTETQKAQALASSSGNYYDVTTAGTMGSAFSSALTTIQSQTTVSKVPMTGVVISDTLSKYVELSNNKSSDKYGVKVKAGDTDFNDYTVAVSEKQLTITLKGNLTDDTVYTASIPVKPTNDAQDEANKNDDAVSGFVSNAGAILIYQYGSDDEKTVDYTEMPKVYVGKQITLAYDKNAGNDTVTGMPDPLSETKAFADINDETISFDISRDTPTRKGYTFKGWATDKNASDANISVGSNEYKIDKDTTLYAIWEAQHTVTYNVSGDTPASSTTEIPAETKHAKDAEVNVADDLSTNEKTKDGVPGIWTFSGWSTSDATVADGKFTMPEKDVTFTGTWTFTPDKHTVKFVDEDGTEISSGEYTYGTKASDIVKPDDPQDKVTKNETKRFKEWNPEIVDVTEDATYTAVYETLTNLYNVTFVDEDEKTVLNGPTQYALGDTPTYEGQEPTKASTAEFTYTFDKWVVLSVTDGPVGTRLKAFFERQNEGIVPVAGNTVYKATYTEVKNKYTVTFVDEDETTIFKEATEYDYGTSASNITRPNDPEKPADENYTYTFAGWTPEITDVTQNVTYKATYTAVAKEKVTVTFDSDGGTEVNAQTFDKGGMAIEPTAPTKDGYTFKEWTLNGEPYDFNTAVTDNIALKATWTANAGYTVDTTKEKHTYEIYQIFTGDYTQVTEGEGNDEVTKDVLTNLVWGQNAPVGKTGPVSDEIVQALNKAAGKELDKDKLTEIEKVVNLESTPIKKVSADGSDPVSVDLPGGYYLIRDVPDSQTEKNDAYTTYITVVVKDYTITPKSALPTIDKQVADDDNSIDGTSEDKNSSNKNPDTIWGESADHAINESFQFKLIATIPAPASGEYNRFDDYETYKLVFHDTMSKGVTFDSIESVKVNNTVVSAEGSDGYTKSEIVTGEDGAQAWSLTIPDVKKYDDLKNGATVTVIYNAHLNKDAIVHNASADPTETNKNSVYLKYSNNPNTGYEDNLGKTESDTVWVFTYKMENIKKADSKDGEALPNAGFTLYDSENKAIKLINNNDGTYTVTDQSVDSGIITEMKSGTDGKFTVIGLDAGNYTLKETSTPSGYNTCDDTTIKIEATHKETDETTKAGLTLTNDSTMSNTIINKSGAILPSTGGIGTTIFYILGSFLVIGAGVILVSRKRMEA